MMTNATIAQKVQKVDGETVDVTYKGGEKKITIPANIPIVGLAPSEHGDIEPGAHVFVPTEKQADGTLLAGAVLFGKGCGPDVRLVVAKGLQALGTEIGQNSRSLPRPHCVAGAFFFRHLGHCSSRYWPARSRDRADRCRTYRIAFAPTGLLLPRSPVYPPLHTLGGLHGRLSSYSFATRR